MRVIGTGYQNYSSVRNIKYPQNKNEFIDTYDINLAIAYLNKVVPFIKSDDLKNFFIPRYSFPQKPQFYHLFNSIVLNSKKPWLTTFETIVPRYSFLLEEHKENMPNYTRFKEHRALKKILPTFLSKNCKKLIAMSDCAKKIQLDFFSQMDFSIEPDKLTTLLPPQSILNDSPKIAEAKDFIEFIFVGNDFFRKGGYEMLTAITDVKHETNFPIKLTIISKIQEEWYGNANLKKIEKTKALIKKNLSWITHLQNVSNAEVLSLLKKADVGLLPTWSDSFGYSILEMQASGIPVITTDVRAIPEINNENCGWMIKLEKNIYGELLEYKFKQEEISKSMSEQLKSILYSIVSDRSLINEKAKKSLSRITKFHNPTSHFDSLTKIYENI